MCGYVRNTGRPGEKADILTLGGLRDTQLDMFSTVFIGSSTTQADHGRMITPRGYEKKQNL